MKLTAAARTAALLVLPFFSNSVHGEQPSKPKRQPISQRASVPDEVETRNVKVNQTTNEDPTSPAKLLENIEAQRKQAKQSREATDGQRTLTVSSLKLVVVLKNQVLNAIKEGNLEEARKAFENLKVLAQQLESSAINAGNSAEKTKVNLNIALEGLKKLNVHLDSTDEQKENGAKSLDRTRRENERAQHSADTATLAANLGAHHSDTTGLAIHIGEGNGSDSGIPVERIEKIERRLARIEELLKSLPPNSDELKKILELMKALEASTKENALAASKSATNAKDSEVKAGSSADRAETAAKNASTSEKNAGSSADEAEASAKNASTSEKNAGSSADKAEASATKAGNSADRASSSANSADKSKIDAAAAAVRAEAAEQRLQTALKDLPGKVDKLAGDVNTANTRLDLLTKRVVVLERKGGPSPNKEADDAYFESAKLIAQITLDSFGVAQALYSPAQQFELGSVIKLMGNVDANIRTAAANIKRSNELYGESHRAAEFKLLLEQVEAAGEISRLLNAEIKASIPRKTR